MTNRPTFTPRTLYAVGQAFSDNAPIRMGLTALTRALRQEFRWILAGGRTRALRG